MRLMSLLFALLVPFPAFAEEGIIFATKDDIKAFDQLIQKRRVTAKRTKKINAPHSEKVRALVRKEAFKKNREILADKRVSPETNNRAFPAKTSSSLPAKATSNNQSRSTSSTARNSKRSSRPKFSRSNIKKKKKKRVKPPKRSKKKKKRRRRGRD